MRNIYIILIAAIILTVFLITFAFLFFEREKHESSLYAVYIGDKNAGYVKTDRYRTEDKIIYKSMDFQPRELVCKIKYEEAVFSKKDFRLERFVKKCENFGATTEAAYLKDSGRTFDFLSEYGSRWSAVSNIEHAEDIAIFQDDAIQTYIPFIDKYDFTRGGAQSFNALYLSTPLLPPARGRVIFRSTRDEYIKIEGKKIKTECLTIRTTTLSDIYLWVSKRDRSIVQLENKKKNLLIKKVGFSQKIIVQDYAQKNTSYNSLDVLFPSGDIALAGSLAAPTKDGKFPAILLVGEDGPYNRENAGLYTDISGEFAQKGYAVLRYDREGIGQSQGANSSVTTALEIRDIENAFKFLANHENIDKDKIFIIAHGEASSYLPLLDFSKCPAKGLIMLAPTKPTAFLNLECEYAEESIKAMMNIDVNYAKTLELLKSETIEIIKNTKKDYTFVQARHVFIKRMDALLRFNPSDGFMKLEVPFLVIYGKKDKFGLAEYINDIERVSLKREPPLFQIVYFRDLGHFLGKLVDEENYPKYYKINQEALGTITNWIEDKCAANLTNP